MVQLEICCRLLGHRRFLTHFLCLLKCLHFLLMGFELFHFSLFFSRTFGELFLEGDWVKRHLMFHHSHSTCSTWRLPSGATAWSLNLLMNFFESSESFLNTHGSICTFLLLLFELTSLVSCQWCALLCVNHRGPI